MQFLNSIYFYPKWTKNKEMNRHIKMRNDALLMVIKNQYESKIEIISNPEIPFYVSNRKKKFQEMYILRSDANEIMCKYADRDKVIAKHIGELDKFYLYSRNNSKFQFKRSFINNNPNIYLADVNIEDYYKTKFILQYGENFIDLKKSFMDIEVRNYNDGKFPHEDLAEKPISSISHVNSFEKTLYMFLLRDPNNPQISQVENNIQSVITKFNAELDIKKYIALYSNINIKFFNSEEELLLSYFKMIHETKPDFCGIWNMKFDIKYIINRLTRLGLDPSTVMCHPDIPKEYQEIKYIQDSKGANKDKRLSPIKMFDWVEIPGYTQFYDQLVVYALLRTKTEKSYKLDDISKYELNDNKIPLSQYGASIVNLEIKNYIAFLKYSMKDSMLIDRLEDKLGDLDKFLVLCGNTRLRSGHKISVKLKNVIMKKYFTESKIIGNDVYYPSSEYIQGAIVSNPANLSTKGIVSEDVETNVYKYVIDFDVASMYPHIMIAYNISKSTIYGRIMDIYNKRNNEFLGKGENLLPLLQTDDVLEIGHRYFGLPNIEDMLTDIEEK